MCGKAARIVYSVFRGPTVIPTYKRTFYSSIFQKSNIKFYHHEICTIISFTRTIQNNILLTIITKKFTGQVAESLECCTFRNWNTVLTIY